MEGCRSVQIGGSINCLFGRQLVLALSFQIFQTWKFILPMTSWWLSVQLPQYQDGTMRVADDALGGAAEPGVFQPRMAVRGQDNEVRAQRRGRVANLFKRLAVADNGRNVAFG